MTQVLDNFKPINEDVLLRHVTKRSVSGGLIYVKESGETDDIQLFKVEAKSDKVTSVNVGDVVGLPWKRITIPMDGIFNGKKGQFGVTSEKEILFVVEDYKE